jgi:cytochrome P450
MRGVVQRTRRQLTRDAHQRRNARQIDSLRELAQTAAARLIDAFASARTVDLVSAFALPFPVEIISAMQYDRLSVARRVKPRSREVRPSRSLRYRP